MSNNNGQFETVHTYEDQFGHVPEELPPIIGRPRRPSRLTGLLHNGSAIEPAETSEISVKSETISETVIGPVAGTFVLQRIGDVAVAYLQPTDSRLV